MKIRDIRREDLQTRVDWMNNPKVYKSMHFDLPVLLDNTIKWFDNIKSNNKRADVCFEENGNILAFGGLTTIDPVLKKAELYVFVDPSAQRSGIGTQATKLLCEYGFDELSLHKIFLITNEDNIAAIRVYEKCGFVLEGRHRDEYLKDGEFKDRLYFGLLKSDLDQ